MPKPGQPDEVWKEYSIGGGSDICDASEEIREGVHNVTLDNFYAGVVNTSPSGKIVIPSPDKSANFTE